MSGADDTEPSRPLYWFAFGCVAVLLLVPLATVDVPPLLDYPNHLARLFVLAHPDDPIYARFYQQRWAIMPNLALDVVVPPLFRLLPAHVVGRIAIGATLLLPLIGCAAYHRALFGRRSLWPLASGVIAYNSLFFLGFLNYQITLGLALLMAAGWVAWSASWPVAASLAGAVGATILFFGHIFGLAFFAILVGAGELASLWALPWRAAPLLRHALRRGAMVAALFCIPVLLYLAAPLSASTGPTIWQPWPLKIQVALGVFAHYRIQVMLVTAAAVLLPTLILALFGRLRAGAGSLIGVATLAAIYLAMPSVASDTAFIDSRLPIMVALLLFAGFQPRPPSRLTGVLLAAIMAAVFLVRIAATASVWTEQGADVAAIRSVIADVEPGSRVLVAAVGERSNPQWWATAPENRILPGWMRLDAHLPALLLIEHHAFWPLLFSAVGHQPLAVRPPYDRLSARQGWIPELSDLSGHGSVTAENDTSYLADWQHDFDYLLLLDPGAAGDPAAVLPDRLELLRANDMAALYRVRRPATP